MNSPGSNHTGDSVTYSAQRISPSGFGWDVGLGWAAASGKWLTTRKEHSKPAATIRDHHGNLRAGFISPPSPEQSSVGILDQIEVPDGAFIFVHSSCGPALPDSPRRDRRERSPDRPAA